MKNRVFVTYASKDGATIRNCRKIAMVLEKARLVISLLPADQAVEISDYQAIILGSPIYAGRWRLEAVTFLEVNENLLINKDVWLFSSGPNGEGEPTDILDGWIFPRGQHDLVGRISPHDIALFHGAIDLNKLDQLKKILYRTLFKNTL